MNAHPRQGSFHHTIGHAKSSFQLAFTIGLLIIGMLAWDRFGPGTGFLTVMTLPLGIFLAGTVISGVCHLFNEGVWARRVDYATVAVFLASIGVGIFYFHYTAVREMAEMLIWSFP